MIPVCFILSGCGFVGNQNPGGQGKRQSHEHPLPLPPAELERIPVKQRGLQPHLCHGMQRLLSGGIPGTPRAGGQGVLDLDTCAYPRIQGAAGALEQQQDILSPVKAGEPV